MHPQSFDHLLERPDGAPEGAELADQRLGGATPDRFTRELLDALPTAIYTTDAAGRLTYYNEAAATLAGRRPRLGRDRWCVIHRLYTPDGRFLPHEQCPMAEALRRGEAVRGVEAVAERPDGTRVPFMPYPTVLHDEAGNVVGAVNTLVEIGERKEAQARRKTLIDEVNHRVKNTLATVQALAQHTLRGAGVPDDVREAFEARLLALSGVHNQLARESWRYADMGLTVCEILTPYAGEGQLGLRGPMLKLQPRIALALAMVLHELAANAASHGALGARQGRVDLRWSVDTAQEKEMLTIEWRESSGPPVRPPLRGGFGLRVLERSVREELDGTIHLDFRPEGLICRITVPLSLAGS